MQNRIIFNVAPHPTSPAEPQCVTDNHISNHQHQSPIHFTASKANAKTTSTTNPTHTTAAPRQHTDTPRNTHSQPASADLRQPQPASAAQPTSNMALSAKQAQRTMRYVPVVLL